jgi:hypothetical protein
MSKNILKILLILLMNIGSINLYEIWLPYHLKDIGLKLLIMSVWFFKEKKRGFSTALFLFIRKVSTFNEIGQKYPLQKRFHLINKTRKIIS